MILDNLTLLSGSYSQTGVLTGQAVTTQAVSNTLDTNPLSIGANQPVSLGRGEDLKIVIGVLVAAATAGAATVNFEFIQADDTALSTNVEILAQTGPIPKATLAINTQVVLVVPNNAPYTPRRYVGLRYTIGTGPLTAGTFVAAIVKDVQDITAIYGKSGFAVS